MDKNSYLAGIGALYAAEVLGEGLASRWLESESKVKLRPLLARHGLSLVEDGGSRTIHRPHRRARGRRHGKHGPRIAGHAVPSHCSGRLTALLGRLVTGQILQHIAHRGGEQRPVAGFTQILAQFNLHALA